MKAILMGAASLAALTSTAAFAQGAEQDADEIVVTALKRADSVQDVAASVDVVGQRALTNSGVSAVEDLKTVVPSLIIQRPPNNTVSVSVRGLGSAAGPVSFDQSVSLFVDGVYAPRGAEFLSALFDVEKVEVVKGTQAAVLGKNTSLGGVLLTTRKPGNDFGIDLLSQYEFERKSKVVSGGIDVPLGETFAVRAAAQYQDLGGYMRNRFDGRRARATENFSARITGRWRPTPDVEATLSYQYEHLDVTGVNAELVQAAGGTYASLYALAGRPDLYEVDRDFVFASSKAGGPSRTKQPSHRVNGTVNWEFGDYSITAVTGWSKFDQDRFIDRDYIVGDYFTEQVAVRGEQFSQELRLVSPAADRLNFIIGGLFVDNSLDQNLTNRTNYPGGILGPVPVAGAYRGTFTQDTTTWSGFGQINFKLTEQLTLSSGIRYTTEGKRATMERVVVTPGRYSLVTDPPFALTRLSRRENAVDGSVGVEFRPAGRILFYASWGQGTKGGGFSDTTLPADAEYRKEVARTFEGGVKLEADDRSWRFNLAGFSTKVRDYQNNQFNGSRFVIQNLNLRSQGVEVQAYAAPAPHLSFNLNGVYAHARNRSQLPGIGDDVPRAPRLSGQIGAEYETGLTDRLTLTLASDVSHRSSITHQTNPNAVPRGVAFTTLNARVSLGDDDAGWQLSLIGRNLTDEYSLAFAFPGSFVPAGNVVGIPEEARTVALQLTFRR